MLAIVAAAFLTAALGLWGYLLATRTADLPAPTATAMVLTVPPSADVAAPTLQSPPTPAPTAPPTDTAPPPPPGQVTLGAYVQVVGTGDAGILNLRSEPGTTKPVNYLALEREVLLVQSGPAEADGFVWWFLIDPATNTKSGWAVQNYLQVVQGP